MKRITSWLLVILSFLPAWTYSQCRTDLSYNGSLSVQGISPGSDHYYRNLIIQDLALTSQKSFNEISLAFQYKLNYQLDSCTQGKIELRVFSPAISSVPVYYRGFDISGAIRPEKADISFQLYQGRNFATDSMLFRDIPVDVANGLYSSGYFTGYDSNASVSAKFSSAVFYYTKASYEEFRDFILQVDRYYAASMIADSLQSWLKHGMLSESGSRYQLMERQIELERIIHMISPLQFSGLMGADAKDPASLGLSVSELQKSNSRIRAIIALNHRSAVEPARQSTGYYVESYFDRLDYYYQLAYRTDFRYLNFVESLSVPAFTNASLLSVFNRLKNEYGIPDLICNNIKESIVNGFVNRGRNYESGGNQPRALDYYRTAVTLADLLHREDVHTMALDAETRMRDSIAVSYMSISRRSALTGNPALAARYFNQAKDLYLDGSGETSIPKWLGEYEIWMYGDFENQVIALLELKNYDKAFAYLNEIDDHCQEYPSFNCPDRFAEWSGIVRQGIYLRLIEKARSLFEKEDYQESGQLYREALAMRQGAGYRIEKSVLESELERDLRQITYEEWLDEALRLFRNSEYISALYYFNRCDNLQKEGIRDAFPELINYRQDAARQIILQNLSEGRVRVWAHDFDGAQTILSGLEKMFRDYPVDQSDSLRVQYEDLSRKVTEGECMITGDEFSMLMAKSTEALNGKDFILARKLAAEAVGLSMGNLKCRIADDEAWYRMVNLGAPAEFQEMENELHGLMEGDPVNYLAKYQELKNYYSRHKIQQYGLSICPLYDNVIASADSAFLSGMFRYYINQRNYDLAFKVVARMLETGVDKQALAGRQREVAGYLARRDASSPDHDKPWDEMHSYTNGDRNFSHFHMAYRKTWLKAVNWKISDWPLLWKK